MILVVDTNENVEMAEKAERIERAVEVRGHWTKQVHYNSI